MSQFLRNREPKWELEHRWIKMTLPLVLFAAAALGGLLMAIVRFSGKPLPPFSIAIIHGVAAALGLILLIVAVSKAGGGASTAALGLLVLAALGGFVLFSQHLRKAALSIPLIVAHASLAVAGFVTLLVSALR
jgi:hypothetical protein